MTFKIASRVWQTTATTGTGTLSLDASSNPTGYRMFASAIGSGNTCPYTIDDGNGNWEEGIGTVTSGTPDTLARTTVINNSLGTTANIDFAAGTKTVQLCPIGSRAAFFNSAPSGTKFLVSNSSGGIDLLSGQLPFPATQNASSDANTLDDYEEGAWTPIIAFDSVSTGITYTSQVGSYVKIGKIVCLQGYIHVNSKGSLTGTLTIRSLPFTLENTATQYGAPCFSEVGGMTMTGSLGGIASPNSTVIIPQAQSNGSMTSLTNTNCADGMDMAFSMIYRATA